MYKRAEERKRRRHEKKKKRFFDSCWKFPTFAPQSYTYANQGIFNVTVTVRSGLKEVGTGYTLAWVEGTAVHVNSRLTALLSHTDSLSAMSLQGETPYGSSASPSTLIASCHGCVNGSFIAYAWIFGDPSEHANDTRLTQTNVAQYQYPYAGIYPIQVVVANNISYAKVALNYTVLGTHTPHTPTHA